MDFSEMDRLASERAQRVAPKPQYEPFIAGITGLMGASIVVSVFMGIAGLEAEAFGQAVSITSALGFAAPFFYFRHEEKKHSKAYSEEFRRIQIENSAASKA
ncbi:hypothetical protein [Mesorhizobium sp. ES1-4]|uniref:hypothetical protein n=1 Tax=Mesorhizobium sp. ES1-4 TaxID=2876627 RepID=UPI001CCC10ED|nr:hypothetical protein [Mesorhizobium sp. ES1-4]MBZ9798801.1 hypothetical protein [Mesorhizobium sp. ES1-4]